MVWFKLLQYNVLQRFGLQRLVSLTFPAEENRVAQATERAAAHIGNGGLVLAEPHILQHLSQQRNAMHINAGCLLQNCPGRTINVMGLTLRWWRVMLQLLGRVGL